MNTITGMTVIEDLLSLKRYPGSETAKNWARFHVSFTGRTVLDDGTIEYTQEIGAEYRVSLLRSTGKVDAIDKWNHVFPGCANAVIRREDGMWVRPDHMPKQERDITNATYAQIAEMVEKWWGSQSA